MKYKYIEVPFKYKNKDKTEHQVCFFIPKSFIKNGDLKGWSLKPENFLGVNLQELIDSMETDNEG